MAHGFLELSEGASARLPTLPLRYDVLPSGLSVPVAWLISGGIHSYDLAYEAQARVFALLQLPKEAVQTDTDAEALTMMVSRLMPILFNEEIAWLFDRLVNFYPGYRMWCERHACA